MVPWRVLVLFFFISFCNGAPSTSPPSTATTPQPLLQIAQRMLSNINRFPLAIQEGMSGKTGGIRKLVSTALGGGLIGQLVENPIQAADTMGFSLDQFGLNKTMLENSIGLTNENPWQMTPLQPLEKGNVLFQSNALSVAPPTTTEAGPLYIDGHIVRPEHEEAVLTRILGKDENDQVFPQKGRKIESARYYQTKENRFNRQPLNRQNVEPSVSNPHGQNFPVRASPPPPVSPAPASDNLDDPAMQSVLPFFNAPPERNFENNEIIKDENKAVINAIDRVAAGNADVRRTPLVRHPEINKMNAKILTLEQRLNEQQELLAKQNTGDKEIKIQKILETLKFGKGNRLSALQKHLRYSPEAVNDDLRLDTNPLKFHEPISCKCEKMSLNQFKGTWIQALSAESLNFRMKRGFAKLFDTKEAKLECAEITVTPPRDYSPAYAHFVMGLRIQNATNLVRLPGNIFPGANNQFTMRLIDFNNEINDIPFCVHKSDKDSRYLVIAESTNCEAATLLVKNTEQSFKTTDTYLMNFLKEKISSNQMDRMEVVEHVNVCS